MKIYVDEMPNNCKECPLYRSGKLKMQKNGRYIDADTCVLGNYYKFQEMDDEIDTCPLATTQFLKQQVREEVVEEIKEKFNDEIKHHFCPNPSSVDFITLCISEVEEFLDNVKGETK